MKKVVTTNRFRRIRRGLADTLRTSWFIHKLIFIIGLMLFTVIIMAYIKKPEYEQGVWIGFIAISNAFSGSLSFLFGITMPWAAGGSGASKKDDNMITCPKCGHTFDISKT